MRIDIQRDKDGKQNVTDANFPIASEIETIRNQL